MVKNGRRSSQRRFYKNTHSHTQTHTQINTHFCTWSCTDSPDPPDMHSDCQRGVNPCPPSSVWCEPGSSLARRQLGDVSEADGKNIYRQKSCVVTTRFQQQKYFYSAATCSDPVAYFGICFEKLQAVVYKHKVQGTQDRTENTLKGWKCNATVTVTCITVYFAQYELCITDFWGQ